MDDHTNNNLDDFFRKSLGDDHYFSSDDGWDMPSNQVWSNIESGLVAPVSGLFISRLSAGILSMIAIVLLLAMSYFMYQFQQEVKESKQEIQDLKQVIAQNNAILEDLKTTLLEPKTISKTNQSLEKNNEINKVPFQKKADEITSTTFSNPLPFSHSKKNHPTFIKKNQQQTSILQQVQQNDKTADFNTQQSSIFTLDNEALSLFNKQKENITLLNSKYVTQQLSLLGFQTKTIAIKNNNFSNFNALNPRNLLNQTLTSKTELASITSPMIVKKSKVSSRWSVGVFNAPTWLFQSNSNRHHNSSSNPAENIRTWEYQHSSIGTKLAWHFAPNFSIETGFNYLKVQKSQDVRHRIEYTDEDINIMQNGDEQVHLTVPFMTNLGNTTIHFEAHRDEHNHGGSGNPNHGHQEHINICFETDQTLKLGTIPLFLKYKTRGHKVRLTAKAGIAHQFLLQGQLNLSDIDLKDRDWRLSQQEDFRAINLKGRLNNRWFYSAGIGVEAKLNSRVTLAVEPTFTRSMQPILAPSEEKFHPMSFQTDIGLNYYF